ncbi:hypothetical protein BV25DRAFT_710516 [Artomyces pyxidatus]|uniref:Uncharacterized protein n=1 Tax=Artomyces pyxidatus TaxID=48021 RepID=A0ACB8SZN1_9AGAM|nr:hypothetical protein BV25DRAFT_710516 [Artomyces pyxidatus]
MTQWYRKRPYMVAHLSGSLELVPVPRSPLHTTSSTSSSLLFFPTPTHALSMQTLEIKTARLEDELKDARRELDRLVHVQEDFQARIAQQEQSSRRQVSRIEDDLRETRQTRDSLRTSLSTKTTELEVVREENQRLRQEIEALRKPAIAARTNPRPASQEASVPGGVGYTNTCNFPSVSSQQGDASRANQNGEAKHPEVIEISEDELEVEEAISMDQKETVLHDLLPKQSPKEAKFFRPRRRYSLP